MSERALERLAVLLREEGGLMSTLVDHVSRVRATPAVDSDMGSAVDPAAGSAVGPTLDPAATPAADPATSPDPATDPATASPARTAAAGPRAEGRREEYELLVEAIYEGYLLHYGAPRVVRPTEADLGLLAGDRLYAIGLSRLVALEDSAAVAELADTITLSALAQAQGEPALADAVWAAGARAVGWGSSAAHRRAKELVLAGAPEAIEAMRTSAAALPASP